MWPACLDFSVEFSPHCAIKTGTIPFLTENTEIHIGKRPQNSIYSGGYTAWQDGGSKQIEIMTNDKKSLKFPRLWWGWLGKRSYLKTINESDYRKQEQNRLKNKRTKGWKKFVRQFKKWILRS